MGPYYLDIYLLELTYNDTKVRRGPTGQWPLLRDVAATRWSKELSFFIKEQHKQHIILVLRLRRRIFLQLS